jgi:hypothetical protein
MDDLVRTGMAIIVALGIAAVMVVGGAAYLLLLELQALAAGDMRFVLASTVVLILVGAAYAGIGLWLRRSGWI